MHVIGLGDKSVLVTFDIEDCPFAYRVSTREGLSDPRHVLPRSSLCDPKPGVQRAFEASVPRSRLLKLLAADYVQCRSSQVRNLRRLYFAKRETVNNI
jgi:hypothetical protein